MMREVWETIRCRHCGAVKAALVAEGDNLNRKDGAERVVWDNVPHSVNACLRFQKLEQETWPVLFDVEAADRA